MDLFTVLPLMLVSCIYIHTYIHPYVYLCSFYISWFLLWELILFSFFHSFFSSHKPSALHIVRIASASLRLASIFFANLCLVMHMERVVKFSNG